LVLYRYSNQPIHSFCLTPNKISSFRPQTCQFCRSKKFHGHGWRRRYVNHHGRDFHIFIQRFKCCNCKRTVTVLPTFLTRKFIRSVDDILSHCIRAFLGLKSVVSRQISAFYTKRFLQYLSPLIMLLNCHGNHLSLPEKENEKAIKVIETAQVQFPNSLSESFFWNTNKHFMAH
jgi:transposase-like protein